MLFDLKKYFSTGKQPVENRFTADLSPRDFAGAAIPEPVAAQFTARRTEEGIALTLKAEAEAHTECARCLEPIRRRYTVDVEWMVRQADLSDPDFELPLDEKGRLDVDEWLFQEFMFQIPTVLVCSADCQGLCPVCGRRRAECSCQTAEQSAPVDARLSILKSLLN